MRRPLYVAPIVLVALGLLSASTACVKREAAVETQPVTDKLSAYWTCAVTFSSDGSGTDANEAFTFVPWFEGRMRERGVFEPLGRDEGPEAEVMFRLSASQSGNEVAVHAAILDARTKADLGELDAFAIVGANGDGGADPNESPRFVALRSAASQILEALREKRRISMNEVRRAPPPPPPSKLPDGPPVAGSAVCTTECHPPASSTSSHDEQYRVSAGIGPTMKELRGCLDRVGAQLVEPAVLLRFAPDGQLRHMRVDVGGYEHLECIQQIRSRLPRGVWTSRASLLRCEYRCTVS
ncbi:MAG: hypothetical protein JWO86_3545 [Myxococcaceae bacterium]|nr:hypothetical protein [Myxococcaceae bacterium]